MQFGIQLRIPVPAAVVILDHILQRSDAAVVHIGRGARNLAERGRFEIGVTGAEVGKASIAPGDAGVV
jgi:hypothetical protein